MACPTCGAETPAAGGECPVCGGGPTRGVEAVTLPPDPSGSHPDEAVTRVPDTPSHALRIATADQPLFAPGQVFGTRYRIIRMLGVGGMGVVYQAWDDELGASVALKVIRPEPGGDPVVAQERERRFKRELVLARQVTHKHVIRIHDLGEIDGIKYITMPFVQGETLGVILHRERRLPAARAVRYARQIVSGLAAAHEAGVVHRDLKPANIMVDADDQALILDFGIARSAAADRQGTLSGHVVGTIDYMAPEQAKGEPVDQRADVYAFGLILSEMLVGRHGASATDSGLASLFERMQHAPPPVRSFDQAISPALDGIITRCLQPEPAARFQTSAELAAALAALDAEGFPIQAAVARKGWPRVAAVAAAAVVILFVAIGGWLWMRGPRAPAAPTMRPVVSVLIPDFENRAGDPVFDGAIEQALSIAVEGASFITAYPHGDAEKILAKVAPGTKLDESGARLVARREGLKTILAGSIAARGSGFDLAVRVIDPAADNPVRVVQVTAKNKGDVLAAVSSLAGKVRAALGDTATGADLTAAAETFTAGSLEAVRDYSAGQELALRRKDEEAIGFYRQAVEHDPQFGRAYAGWATSAFMLGRTADATANWNKALSLMDRMTEREKYRTLGGYYLGVSQDYEKAVENYETLVRLYPADTAGHSNLALSYFYVRNFPKALDEGRRAMEIWPRSIRFRSNYALYAMYAGDFANAAKVAQAIIDEEPKSFTDYLPSAVAAAVERRGDDARRTYERMAATGGPGASLAGSGLGDLALFLGQPAAAREVLARSVAADEKAGNTVGVISKQLAIADASLQEGNTAAAVAAAAKAVKAGRGEAALVPAARVYLAAGKASEAQAFAAELQGRVPTLARAFGKVIEGEVALAQKKPAAAIDAFRAATKLADVWLAHYDAGVAYVEAGMFAEALSELELCQKRRGEATAVFFDDWPTVHYLAPLDYWLGRAKEGLNMKPAAIEHYKLFLALRPEASRDPLAIDARKRVGAK
jgi:eukaryotic-like serine/threonine-protein kinase